MLINVKIISKQLISPNLGKHIHSRNFLAAPNPNSLVFFRSYHQVGLVCSQGENHWSKPPPHFTAGGSEEPRSERDEPKALGLEFQRPDIKSNGCCNQGPGEREKE